MSPQNRQGPLRTSASSLAAKGVKKRRTKRLTDSERLFTANRLLVLDRDGGRCFVCGAVASDVHHRVPRGAGGSSRNPDIHSPAGLISLCRACHDRVESHREWAFGEGLLVHRGTDPAGVPVRWLGVAWRLLTADGGIIPLPHAPTLGGDQHASNGE